MANREQHVETFQAVTNTDSDTAERVLSAHRWDLDRAVEFFMEQGMEGVEALPEAGASSPVQGDGDFRNGANELEPIILEDDDDVELQEILAASRRAAGTPP